MSRYAPQGSQARVNSRVFCSGGSLGAALAGPDSFSGPPALSNSPRPELSPAAVLESCRGSQSPALRARDKRRPHELQNRPGTIATMSIIWRTQMARLLADPGFTPASSGLENGFFRTADQIPPQRTREVRWR